MPSQERALGAMGSHATLLLHLSISENPHHPYRHLRFRLQWLGGGYLQYSAGYVSETYIYFFSKKYLRVFFYFIIMPPPP
jgi:hypothetical protein